MTSLHRQCGHGSRASTLGRNALADERALAPLRRQLCALGERAHRINNSPYGDGIESAEADRSAVAHIGGRSECWRQIEVAARAGMDPLPHSAHGPERSAVRGARLIAGWGKSTRERTRRVTQHAPCRIGAVRRSRTEDLNRASP